MGVYCRDKTINLKYLWQTFPISNLWVVKILKKLNGKWILTLPNSSNNYFLPILSWLAPTLVTTCCVSKPAFVVRLSIYTHNLFRLNAEIVKCLFLCAVFKTYHHFGNTNIILYSLMISPDLIESDLSAIFVLFVVFVNMSLIY